MFDSYRRERNVGKALHLIAGQRVVVILHPGNVPVIENSPTDAEWFDIAVRTAHIRGWVEVLHDAIPSGQVSFEGSNPIFPEQLTPKVHYRLTEGGWSVIHRTHGWTVWTFWVAFLGLLASALAVVFAWPSDPLKLLP